MPQTYGQRPGEAGNKLTQCLWDKDFLGYVLGNHISRYASHRLVKQSCFKSGADRSELLRRTKDGFLMYCGRQAGTGDLKSGTFLQDCAIDAVL